jgi:hypothetical protein
MDAETKNKILMTDKLQDSTSLEDYFTPKISMEIPTNFSVKVRDYHEFKDVQHYYKHLGLNFEFEIVGRDKLLYEAVFYIGPKPEILLEKINQKYCLYLTPVIKEIYK